MVNSITAGLIGQRVANRYDLERLIGEGGFGAVFSARDRLNGRLFAIKILYIDTCMNQAQRAKELRFFKREVGVLSRVQHPGIVSIYNGGLTEEGLPYLVMELAEGDMLSRILRREGPMTLPRTARILSLLCEAVAEIHKQGFIHRDLKPENIIVRRGADQKETIKLLDFGMAKLVRGEGDDKWLRTLTALDHIQGTLYYMSPEQTQRQKLDERTDIYSLGVMVFEMLAGKRPFRAKYPIELMMQHLEAAPPSLRSFRPKLPVKVEIAILKALEKDRNLRYSNVLEFSETINQIVAEEE